MRVAGRSEQAKPADDQQRGKSEDQGKDCELPEPDEDATAQRQFGKRRAIGMLGIFFIIVPRAVAHVGSLSRGKTVGQSCGAGSSGGHTD